MAIYRKKYKKNKNILEGMKGICKKKNYLFFKYKASIKTIHRNKMVTNLYIQTFNFLLAKNSVPNYK